MISIIIASSSLFQDMLNTQNYESHHVFINMLGIFSIHFSGERGNCVCKAGFKNRCEIKTPCCLPPGWSLGLVFLREKILNERKCQVCFLFFL